MPRLGHGSCCGGGLGADAGVEADIAACETVGIVEQLVALRHDGRVGEEASERAEWRRKGREERRWVGKCGEREWERSGREVAAADATVALLPLRCGER